MNGHVISFLKDKNYGFIKDENDKSYYFKAEDFVEKNVQILDMMLVCFEIVATPKGYRAKNIKIIPKNDVLYEICDQVYTSRTNEIKGWEVLQRSKYIISNQGRGDPKKVLEDLKLLAVFFRANALLDVNYNTEVGSESGSGRGTHHYTIHVYYGRLALVAKPSLKGVTKTQIFKKLILTNLQRS